MTELYRGIISLGILLFGTVAALPAGPEATRTATLQTPGLQREARLIVDLLQNFHYSGRPFRDVPNEEIVERYLTTLDPSGEILTEPDRAALRRRFGRSLKSVYLFRGDLQPATELFDRFMTRATARLDWIEQQLQQPLAVSVDPTSEPHDFSRPAKDAGEADLRWLQRLRELVGRQQRHGYDEVEARRRVSDQFARYRKSLTTVEPVAVRERFLDAMLRCYDPHSGYFSAETSRVFSLAMGATAYGTGLTLAHESEGYTVTDVLPGSPADLESDIRSGDLVAAITNKAGDWVATAQRRQSEITALLAGGPDSEVSLRISRPGDPGEHEVTLRRAKLIQPAERARGAIITIPASEALPTRRLGVIWLPSFYGQPAEGAEAASATKDVRVLLARMKAGGLDGLVIDLRDNPGGLLLEAVSLAGLFIRNATIMHAGQVGKEQLPMISADEPATYDGPLVVLTSRRTASAGEAFAGAIQFHRRGVIAGDESTYGKGSMQIYMELGKSVPGNDVDKSDWGTLRVTAELYYLPDGRTVQSEGVKADIVLPASKGESTPREADLDHALPSVTLSLAAPAQPAISGLVDPVTPELIGDLRLFTASNTSTLPEWSLWRESDALSSVNRKERARLAPVETEQEFTTRLSALADLRRKRQEWTVMDNWEVEPVEVPEVKAVFDAKVTTTRRRSAAFAPSELLRRRQAFVVESGGDTREIPLGRVDFLPFIADARLLAGVFSSASGRPVDGEGLAIALRAIAGLEKRTLHEILGVLQRHFPDDDAWSDETRTAGLAALLAALPALEPHLDSRPRINDAPLREALRIAAAWAQRQSTPQSVSIPNSITP